MRTRRLIHRAQGACAAALAAVLMLAGCSPVYTETASHSLGQTHAPAPSAAEHVADHSELPEGFSSLDEAVPGVMIDARYATRNNFTGAVVEGYSDPSVAILRTEAAEALAEVQQDLVERGLGLLVWDAFRPTRAVDDFVAWSATPDDHTRAEYYPDHEKAELFELGYIARESRHTLGGTVDLTIIDADSGEQLDMGGPFDFFGERSHFDAPGITPEQQANRVLLRSVMETHGFEPYPLEWWHFTYPLPEETQPADFPVR